VLQFKKKQNKTKKKQTKEKNSCHPEKENNKKQPKQTFS